ncbi:S1C family serine protease [Mucilaginibacter aquariorum]|uniref:Trypsin-like peptidase domain-containing protein n=1 Tax=Mucilaginibacter aquariorum TaxID=2967225 RepID=A0ABT1TAF7_9SPHI|nr:trypsin-like peptidase domain-containing protein [Mucilaginibacter aquariorum]MCQ6961587.1 trypsin-like peptidase domain-containing protein [Mucilaginibacter aquariorum]
MKNPAISILCALQLLLPLLAAAQSADLSYAAAKALPAVVRVQSYWSDSLNDVRAGQALRMGIKSSGANGSAMIGSASGVLLSPTGDIITNAHILNGGDSLVVILTDRRTYRARLTGMDEATDLALLQISENGLPFLELGEPSLVRVGEPVLAVGNPLELNSTVTSGILSARYRPIDEPETPGQVNSFLQTDAASNEGMSGSALVDRNGKLIGINSAIISPNGTFAGYAFAISADLVKKVWQDLSKYGRVQHAQLDITFQDMDDAQGKRLGTPNIQGVVITKVLKNGAGERAGLRKNDIISRFDQQNLICASQLRELLAQHAPDDRVALTVRRSQQELTVSVTLSVDHRIQSEKITLRKNRKSRIIQVYQPPM